MRSCWTFTPEERPNFGELVEKIDHLNMPQNTQNKPMIRKRSTAGYLPIYS